MNESFHVSSRMSSQKNPELQGHKDKCRCCFKQLKSAQKTVEISKFIEKRFLVLTGIELIYADFYSSVICESCNSKLSEFADFRQEMFENQTSLYKFEPYEECQLPDEAVEELVYEEVLALPSEEVTGVTQGEPISKAEDVEEEFEDASFQIIDDVTRKSVVKPSPASSKETKASAARRNPQKGRRKDCHLCGLSVAVNGWYHHVLRAHTNQARFVCDSCGKGFRVKNDLKEHCAVHMSVGSRPKYPCSLCSSVLLSRSSLKNHQNTFHSNVVEQHPCEECGKIFISRMKLNQHRLNVHVKGSFPCHDCAKVYSVKAVLQKHITQHHREKVPCEVCHKLFPPGNSLERHLKSHELGNHPCPADGCNKVFRSKRSLMDHTESHHNSNTETVICQICAATFTSEKNLNRHIARQHSNIRIQCEVEGCNHSSSRKDYLAAHYRRHKDIDENTRSELLARVRGIKMIPW